jgi:mono/diheme cytochrome c family protein
MRYLPAMLLIAATLSAATPIVAAESVAADDVAAGKALYRRLCASCHGVDGRGDGPVAPALGERPTDLTTIAREHDGTFSALAVATAIDGTTMPRAHGVSDMPVWGEVLAGPDADDAGVAKARDAILLLTDYLRSIQRP